MVVFLHDSLPPRGLASADTGRRARDSHLIRGSSMDWLSDLVGGSADTRRDASETDPVERAWQLLEGVASSAGALDDEHGELSRRTEEAARRIAAGLRSGDGSSEELAAEALDRLDRLHFALLRVVVQGVTPEEAGAEAAVESAEELAGRTG